MIAQMIESIMYFGIGFLLAALSVLIVAPLVHDRAVRLTMRPAGSYHPAIDGRSPSRQGSAARRIRYVDTAAAQQDPALLSDRLTQSEGGHRVLRLGFIA